MSTANTKLPPHFAQKQIQHLGDADRLLESEMEKISSVIVLSKYL